MTDETNHQAQRSRIKVDDLPQATEELSDKEARDVKGGLIVPGPHVQVFDSSVPLPPSTQNPPDPVRHGTNNPPDPVIPKTLGGK